MTNFASVATLALLAQAAPGTTVEPKPAKVFLVVKAQPNVKTNCLSALAGVFKAEIGKAKGVLAVTSRADADVVVEVPECASASTANVGGEVEVSSSRGARQGNSARLGIGGNPLSSPVASVTLTVEDAGRLRQFTAGPQPLPIDEATRTAVQSLLAWLRSRTPQA